MSLIRAFRVLPVCVLSFLVLSSYLAFQGPPEYMDHHVKSLWNATRFDNFYPSYGPQQQCSDSPSLNETLLPEQVCPLNVFDTKRSRNETIGGHGALIQSEDRNRFEQFHVWRADAMVGQHELPHTVRPFQPNPEIYSSKQQYLQQTLVADYDPQDDMAQNIFLMIKTGATVLWKRLPIHLLTTCTKLSKFAFYSDMPSSIAGFEVIDALKYLPQQIVQNDQLKMYRMMDEVRSFRYDLDASAIKFGDDNKGWETDKFKNLLVLYDAYLKAPESDWFVMIDGDSYVFWDNMKRWLASLDPNDEIYTGSPNLMAEPFDFNGKQSKLFAHGGSGIVLSRGSLKKLFDRPQKEIEQMFLEEEEYALDICCGDIALARSLLKWAGIRMGEEKPDYYHYGFQGEPLRTMAIAKYNWCTPVMTMHHMTPREIELMWEFERLHGDRPITFAEIYKQFVLPYAQEFIPNKKFTHFDRKFTNPDESYAMESPEACRAECESDFECMAWTHYEGFCGTVRMNLRPGLAASPLSNDYPGSLATSGYMINRIREWRSAQGCDGLSFNQETKKFEGDETEFEGWYLRAMTDEILRNQTADSV